VHVLIEEKSRENWGRGSVLAVDRKPVGTAAGKMTGDFVVVSSSGSATRAPDHARSNERLGYLVATAQDGHGELAITTWSSEDAWRLSGASEPEATLCDRVDLPDGGGLRGVPQLTRHLTMSTHEVRPEKLDEYLELRRIAVNPGMARLQGFVSSDILCKRATPNAFLVVNQWLSKEDADRYGEGPLHQFLKGHVRALLLSHSGTREFTVRTGV
jgi:heme-degrading monooxygenase HmoA